MDKLFVVVNVVVVVFVVVLFAVVAVCCFLEQCVNSVPGVFCIFFFLDSFTKVGKKM